MTTTGPKAGIRSKSCASTERPKAWTAAAKGSASKRVASPKQVRTRRRPRISSKARLRRPRQPSPSRKGRADLKSKGSRSGATLGTPTGTWKGSSLSLLLFQQVADLREELHVRGKFRWTGNHRRL